MFDGEQLGQSVKDIESYSELIAQIKSEKALAKGIEARALAKQLLLTQEIYRSLLWKLVDDLQQAENKAEHEQVTVTSDLADVAGDIGHVAVGE